MRFEHGEVSVRATITAVSSDNTSWFAVRCVFATGWLPRDEATPIYEERITLWRASSAEEAIERAEIEALEYAGGIDESPDTYLGLAQSYRLVDPPGDGAEVFSLMRESSLAPDDYLGAFFSTGTERQQQSMDEPRDQG